MNKNIVIILVLIAGLAIGYGIGACKVDKKNDSGMSSTMMGMMAGLDGKTGDEFDKAFLKEMIVHHEGAVVMAAAAQKNAKHTELKTMTNEIISAQTREIAQMKGWLKQWYGMDATPNTMGEGHVMH